MKGLSKWDEPLSAFYHFNAGNETLVKNFEMIDQIILNLLSRNKRFPSGILMVKIRP